MSPRRDIAEKGFALVLVLAFLVLLLGVGIAFFSRSMIQRQVSSSSATRLKTEMLAQQATQTILGDLRSEIVAGSKQFTAGSGTATNNIYYPKSPSNAVPLTSGFATNEGLENLLKVSRDTDFPSLNGNGVTLANRASSVSTTNPAPDGRYVTPSRWNAHLLLRKQDTNSATDFTPVNAFPPPHWVFVARDGSNPTTWKKDMAWSSTNPTTVVGRYAYAIYDEGGLLDANVAGFPPKLTNTGTGASNVAYKSALAYADLTQIGLTPDNVASLVQWRNGATIAGGETNYISYVAGNTNGFLTIGSTNLASGLSDQFFGSRQQLIDFVNSHLGGASNAPVQNALQYLTHFTRDLNQPSLVKAQSRDPALLGYTNTAPKILDIAAGGNNQAGLDALVNPPFPQVRVKTSFTRNDGTTAQAGEPLVKTRFPLNRLAWLTCKGPSGNRDMADEDMQALIQKYGISGEYLKQGTEQNIRRYFGLRWQADPGSKLGKWVYDVHNGPSGSGDKGTINRLGVTGDKEGLANLDPPREPDFFELLKASIDAGSKAKAATLNMATLAPPDVQAQRDISLNYAVMQLGANIIAQSRVDGFGVRLRFDDGEVDPKEFYGVINLPYIYRARFGVLKIRGELPIVTDAISPVANAAPGAVPGNTTGSSDEVYGTSIGTLLDAGASMVMLLPEIWNPHDERSSSPPATLRPTLFRIVADSADPDTILKGGNYNQVGAYGRDYKAKGNPESTTGEASNTKFTRARWGTGVEIAGGYKGYLHPLTPTNTAMTFNIPTNSMFREPTLLARTNVPAGSNLKIDSSRWSSNSPPEADYLLLQRGSGKLSFTNAPGGTGGGFTADVTNPLVLPTPSLVSANTAYVGIPFGLLPVQWIGPRRANQTPTTMRNIYRSDGATVAGSSSVTLRMQYQDPTNPDNWITYDMKYLQPRTTWLHNILGASSAGGLMQGESTWACFADPRTSRFGAARVAASGSATDSWNAPGSAKRIANNTAYGYGSPETTPANPSEWIDQANGVLVSARPAANAGFSIDSVPNQTGGWNSPNMLQGLLSQNSLQSTDDKLRYSGVFGTDPYPRATSTGANYYADADGVVRRAMGGYASGSSTVGLPLAATMKPGGAVIADQSQSRPWILNRPFRSVAELGYVFSDTPWKNLDFFTPESGDAGLLEAFCVNDSEAPLVAGKLNLNTKQVPVLRAVLAGASRDERNAASLVLDGSAGGLAEKIADILVKRTQSTSATGGKLQSMSELVGRWKGGSTSPVINGSANYDGLTADLSQVFGATSSDAIIQRFRESAIRPLASVGTTRVWNLMFDLIVQTGRFPSQASKLSQFTAEGEVRYWVHISIDRLTGEVLDEQMELVKE